MFDVVCKYYTEHQAMPPEDELEAICREMFPMLHGMVPKVSFEDLLAVFRKKQAHFAERIEKNGIPEPRKPKVKKTEAEKLALKKAQRKAKKEKT